MQLIKLSYIDVECDVIVLKNSQSCLLLADIREFAFYQYIIIAKNAIDKISYNRLDKYHEKLFKQNFDCTKIHNLEWLDISSDPAMFQTLKDNYNEICIDSKENDISRFLIGQITHFTNQYLYLNPLTVYGKISAAKHKIRSSSIMSISFCDEYSKVLFEYAKKECK
ncbi:hypothetical protein AGMMS50229_00680 [Campylobacterota bacterium]|nr:hypothetical protein AGMMS50229_00680 [Campylobacterota bacterium]